MDILEIEIKAYCDDHDAVVEKAVILGARHGGAIRERDLYFNHPARDFRKTDEALRLRQVDRDVVLTYKGPKLGTGTKTRREVEVAVDGFEKTLEILKLLGFLPSGTVEKERDIYRLGDIEICVDRVEGVGNFVELELKGTDRERVEKELFSLAGELGLSRFETKSYLELKYLGPGK
ncbi:MAG TPA: class IV adenylate cyclase [Spirochaetota bacterium]|nr:class IV adenylate cyclase [Spirochaetota bacterium]HPC41782.1 class IV adenylate cyclase [Spirochaetota bacterium]HPL18412.1 class IV adenylate cyclase [Spirochaetota bacterium]HQF06619.1 class IV adenylate cyclase [Spirochaetota bacterium]HQH95978.1 class IV adenylate cyclase [Spirochaetota bacterium]